MNERKAAFPLLAAFFAAICPSIPNAAQGLPKSTAIDAEVGTITARTHANGMAVAVIETGNMETTPASRELTVSRRYFFSPSASTTAGSTFAGCPFSFHTTPNPPR